MRYPASWNGWLTGLTVFLLGLTLMLARQRSCLSWGGLLGGALAWLGGLGLLLAAGWGLLALVAAAYPQYGAFYDRAAYNAPAYQAALLLLGLAVFGGYYGALSRGLRPGSLVGGALVVAAGLLGLLQWRAASSAFLLSLPLLAATLAWGLRLRRAASPSRPPAAGLGEWLLALPAVALLAQVIYLLVILFGLGNLALVALLLLAVLLGLVLPVLLPTLARPAGIGTGRPAAPSWALPRLALAASVGALAVGHFTRQPTPDQPQQTHLYYALDAAHGRAYWLSAAARPDAWTRHALSRPQLGPLPALFPAGGPVLHQDAPALPLAAPTLTVLADSQAAGLRWLRLRLRTGRANVNSLIVNLSNAGQLRALQFAGQAVAASALPPASLTFFAPRPEGEILRVALAGQGPLRLAITSRSLGLPPGAALPPLPATMVPAPGYNSFTTQVRQEFSF